MKILCVSDQIDPLIYSNNIKERFNDIDLILSAGDIPMEYLDFIVSSLNRPLYFIFGNHNLNEFALYHKTNQSNTLGMHSFNDFNNCYTYSSGASYIGFKTKREKNLLLAGVSGSIRYNTGLNQYTERQMKIKLIKLIPALLLNKMRYGRFLDILLTHASPAGIHDKPDPCHRGFKSFLWFMRVFRPKFLIHGHIHLYDLQDIRVTKYHETTVINAYSHFILDTEAYSS